MSRHVLHVNDVDALPVLGAAMIFLASARERCAHPVLTVTGYLRPRPDRAVEDALRAAFAELDRDLAALLGDEARRPGSHR